MSDDLEISRRRLLGTVGAAGVAGLALGAAGGAAGYAALDDGDGGPALTAVGSARVPFRGAHQAGIVQPPQAAVTWWRSTWCRARGARRPPR